ncbi:hypothetical protein [Duganella violaceipulchra]|uniref:Lipoprotein n=1 Tax=Duganella violaceipulchra TaxID=2849652 RepID=A0AA41HAW7_9BURK|nr:hypothetical protein [Duganella violaceicalia]MBV6323879.1 hypothetical protein [Duganella violaceicalia]MCP2011142.1 hypothetical protein [Duganella violaceicalia]
MKSLYLRSGLALVCAALLNACGGGNGNLALSGGISGLTKPDLVLINNKTGEKLPIAAGATGFVFTKLAAVDEEFDIQVFAGPTGGSCKPIGTSNVGKANAYTSGQIGFACQANPWTLGGTVSGLSSTGPANTGLILANGADTVSVPRPATAGAPVSFTFGNTVGDGSPYGVTVLAQPNNPAQTCTLASNVGTMPAGGFLGVTVTCN